MRPRLLLNMNTVLGSLAFILALAFMFSAGIQASMSQPYDRITSRSVPDPSAVLQGKQDRPVLVNVGVEACPPCQLMAESLLDLQQEYAKLFDTHYYDVHRHKNAAQTFGIRMVPTQVYYDREGQELFRHEGYLSRTHILDRWRDLGYEIQIRDEAGRIGDYFSLDYILSQLGAAVQGAPLTAMLAAFVWGILSIILSPCHLAGIPLIIGYINRQKVETTTRAVLLSLLFALGILVSILIIGIITAMAGRILGDLGPLPYYLVAGVFILFGLYLSGVIPMNCFLVNRLVPANGSRRGAVLLGLILGVGLGPCTFVFIAPMLGMTLTLSAADQAFGFLLLGIFAMSHCLFLVLAGTSARFINFFLRWNELSLSAYIIRITCALLLVAGGVYLIFTT